MGLGRKIGRGFLKMAEMGDQIDRGLDEVFGENRNKPGQGVSRDNAGRRAAAFTEKNKGKDFFGDTGKDKSEDLNFLDSGKSGKKNKDERDFF